MLTLGSYSTRVQSVYLAKNFRLSPGMPHEDGHVCYVMLYRQWLALRRGHVDHVTSPTFQPCRLRHGITHDMRCRYVPFNSTSFHARYDLSHMLLGGLKTDVPCATCSQRPVKLIRVGRTWFIILFGSEELPLLSGDSSKKNDVELPCSIRLPSELTQS